MKRQGPSGFRALCRDCGSWTDDNTLRCVACGSPRVVNHPELQDLTIAHIDCDAFYATIEKRDEPSLADKPVIVGGGRRGVVAACCYLARVYGVHSAMPMFKALKLCPHAVVIPPDMAKYAAVGRSVREMMLQLSPAVEPLSIDEAFIDLSGTARIHRATAAEMLARFARDVEQGLGITVSIGLSYNKFLAKVASDLDKPRGFAVLGRGQAKAFLEPKPVSLIWGVGQALERRLHADGIHTIGQLRELSAGKLVARYGAIGRRLSLFAAGEDDRAVTPDQPVKSVSAETTFETDISDPEQLLKELWPLCERVSARLKRAGMSGRTVVLKLKDADFRLLARNRRLPAPTQFADTLFETARVLLMQAATGRVFRLIGVGCTDLSEVGDASEPSLFDDRAERRLKAEAAIDTVRHRLGSTAITKGRNFKPKPVVDSKER